MTRIAKQEINSLSVLRDFFSQRQEIQKEKEKLKNKQNIKT